jgi:hypothetical protein
MGNNKTRQHITMEKTEIDALVKEYAKHNKVKVSIKDHIVELLALGVGLLCAAIYCMVLFRVVKTSESTTITILTSVTNLFLMVISYYFGSSKSSKDKDKQISELQEEKK